MNQAVEQALQKYNPKNENEAENALKEIIQEITLMGLARGGLFKKAAFYGGTALRIFYRLPRFSEDLDFTLLQPDLHFKLKSYFQAVSECLAAFGFEVTVEEVQKAKKSTIDSAFLKADTKLHFLKIKSVSSYATLLPSKKAMKVKFEVDCSPAQNFETVVESVLPPFSCTVQTLTKSCLFSGKMHAVLFRKWNNRVKGRDFYDILWFLSLRVPLHLGYLEQKMRQGGNFTSQGPLTLAHVLELLDKRFDSLDFEEAKADVLQFVQNPLEVEAWNKEYFKGAVRGMTDSD